MVVRRAAPRSLLHEKEARMSSGATAAPTAATKCIYVLSEIDGFKYKLVMEGDVRVLTTAKVKRYLRNATGLCPQHQMLSFNGRIMQDEECGGDVGLTDRAILRLQHVNVTHQMHNSSGGGSNVNTLCNPSPSKSGSSCHRKPTSARNISSSPSTARGSTSHRGDQHRDAHDRGGNPPLGSLHVDTDHHTGHSEDVSDAPRLENARLRERVLELERQLVNVRSDWRLQEEIDELKGTVARLEREKDAAERVAEKKWHAKEEELVRELDILREERRGLRREQALFEEEHRALVRRLEEQIRLQSTGAVCSETRLPQSHCGELRHGKGTLLEIAEKSLANLSSELHIPPLQLDENDTCVVPLDDGVNILVTMDSATERLFMYATIANTLPSSPEIRLKLFETLLEGALLGREMAGGGVGICTHNDLIIMDVCVDMAHADEYALASIARPFMMSVHRWIKVVQGVVSQEVSTSCQIFQPGVDSKTRNEVCISRAV